VVDFLVYARQAFAGRLLPQLIALLVRERFCLVLWQRSIALDLRLLLVHRFLVVLERLLTVPPSTVTMYRILLAHRWLLYESMKKTCLVFLRRNRDTIHPEPWCKPKRGKT